MIRITMLLGLALAATPLPASAQSAAALTGTERLDGLLPVHIDRAGGRILLSLPAPARDGVSTRLLYSTALRTGLGSAPIGLDIGAANPAEIAVAVLADIIRAFRRRGLSTGDAA